ncbi:MAG: hypothetical protein NT014_00040 [Candidatus Omnitrophica bacterium]|nr:hypothetical protein [Candidatus Omnitrophota bacterium]
MPQELNLVNNGGKPTSLALFGSNSSGKTSFVDGLEWFLSSNNVIDWLKREDAGERAYPHQEAKEGESYVEIEFYDEQNKKHCTLVKLFDQKKVTRPKLSSESDFKLIYNSFIIQPYLRYLEVINFVYNSTGAQKYQILASWMGFEEELAFQEKIALEIIPEIESQIKLFSSQIEQFERTLAELINSKPALEVDIIIYCNELLKRYGQHSFNNMGQLKASIGEIEKLKTSSASTQKLSNLSRIELSLNSVSFDLIFGSQILSTQKEIEAFEKKKEQIQKIDKIDLYTKAYDILTKEHSEDTKCPLCGVNWKSQDLKKHINEELAMLKSVKEEKDKLLQTLRTLKASLRIEQEKVNKALGHYADAKVIIVNIVYSKLSAYQEKLNKLGDLLEKSVLDGKFNLSIMPEEIKAIQEEKEEIKKLLLTEKNKIQPSQEDIKLSNDIEKLKKLNEVWESLKSEKEKKEFFTGEVNKFMAVCKEISTVIHDNITKRFGDLSSIIRKYFNILRRDKDIKDINIVLNLEKGRATGRSAEIQLSYYNISTKPAYKVLSESLLNSLGLAVYFTCIKQFNDNCKFIVLDDIMNSLDMGHRDTLLDLISQEFKDYQVILFTHDLFWFQKIQKRFPDWITKKIKGWDYKTGPKIDLARTPKEDIEELLQDATKVDQAGGMFAKGLESILNQLCERLHAETRHRFTKNDPPTLEELLGALYKRLVDKLKNHPVVSKVKNANKYEPLVRNFTSHAKENYPTSISPEEVRRAIEEWEKADLELFCKVCNRYVEYNKDKDAIECHCGNLKLLKTE